jgi:hypothetical protein
MKDVEKRKKAGKSAHPRATRAQVLQRVEEVLRIRLDGAEFWDVREYAREKEKEAGSAWELKDGAKPLSDGQLWRYVGRADELIAASCRSSRKRLLRRHLAQRRNLTAKAISAGDYRAALAALRDEAELQKLYPSRRVELTGKRGGPVRFKDTLGDVSLDQFKALPPADKVALLRGALGLEAEAGPEKKDEAS